MATQVTHAMHWLDTIIGVSKSEPESEPRCDRAAERLFSSHCVRLIDVDTQPCTWLMHGSNMAEVGI
jgi:hypothetical protein